MRMNPIRLLVLATLASALLGGCYLAGAAWAIAGLEYGASKIDENGGYRDYETNLETVWPIVLKVLKKRGIEKTMDDVTYDKEKRGTVKEGDGVLKVFEHPKYDGFTRVYVKVGTFQTDKKYNSVKEFLDEISDELGE